MSEIGVGLVGYKFMGRAHSNAYRQVARCFDVDPAPRMVALCGRDEPGVRVAAEKLGWEGYETDYRALVARDDIGLVDVATTGASHAEIALAAMKRGKHVLCEKPLANSLDEAEAMMLAAEDAAKRGLVAMVNFNYRRVPAVQLARQLVTASDHASPRARVRTRPRTMWSPGSSQEFAMANYVVLMNWTDKGVKSAKDTVKRSQEAAKVFEKMGSTLKDIYWTAGGYDLVAVVSAPDDETLAALLLSLGGAGNLRTHTLRAFTADEVTGILAKMP